MQFCEEQWEDNSGQVWWISAVICGSSVFEIVFSEKLIASESKDPQMTLSITRLNVSHICSPSTDES